MLIDGLVLVVVLLLLSNPWYERIRSGRYPDLTHQIQNYNLQMSGQTRPVSIVEDPYIKNKCLSFVSTLYLFIRSLNNNALCVQRNH